ncbi:MAG: hypothetical protein IPN65_02115 [Elusimicrobia bacterium]|jgi:hypothetical protein|nr:hypothetical protein [Elusimicrobiota bacterium]MBK7544680.1 hypothetical protein [Elusimicrobiota bacterium]MBK7574213.1 hypothetical protein [Elusimicrobiota bacterium]MBK7688847.1 hypothetical protein [Elusimicrobiota bacterium]MBK8126342.1 hypothetical protein [Elusimicrobiota bacterium]
MKRLFLAITALTLAGTLAATERPMAVRGARALGMGDAFTAMADDQNIFFYNPAGLVQRTGSAFTLLDIPVTVGNDVTKIIDFINDNEDDLKNFDTLLPARQAALINQINRDLVTLRPTFGFGAPNLSYLSGPVVGGFFWGAGLFGQASGRVGFVYDVLTPSLYYDINIDAAPMVSLAKHFDSLPILPGHLGVGATLKYLNRAQASDTRVSFIQLDSYDAPPLQRGKGHGIDFGALYQPTARLNIAATWMDFGGTQLKFDALAAEDGFDARPARTAGIPQRLNVGVAWTPARLGLGPLGLPTGDRLTLAADVRDVLNEDSKVLLDGGLIADSAGKHIHLGAEYRWWFLRFRAGANQGYATAGLGIDIPVLKLDYAFFSDEEGDFAGSLKHSAHIVSLALRFGSGRTEAQERVGAKPAPAPTPAPPATATEKAPEAAPAPAN